MADVTIENVGQAQVVDVARGHLYSFMASTFSDPSCEHFDTASDPNKQKVAAAAATLLATEAPRDVLLGAGEKSPAELTLAPVIAALQAPRTILIEEHQKVFGLLIGQTAPLNETEYCRSTEAFFRAQQLADIAGFYTAFGVERNADCHERVDHLSIELEFMAHLIEKELFASGSTDSSVRGKAPVCRDAQRNFFEAHLMWWVPAFAALLRKGTPTGFYRALADSLAAFITGERVRFRLGPNLGLPTSSPTPGLNPEETMECGPSSQ